MDLLTTLKTIQQFRETIRNIADNTIRFHWTCSEWSKYRKEHILENEYYKKLPRWAIEYIAGYSDAMMEQIERLVVFSYIIDEKGTRATIDSDAYRAVSSSVISKCYSHTGCFVWRVAPDKFWTQPKNKG